MPETPGFPAPGQLLFTYGTLMLTTGIPAVDDAMHKAGVSLGRAYVHGFLYDLGEYPGAVVARVPADGAAALEEDAPKVWGHLLRLDDPAALFAVIDSYEGYNAADLRASEFVRAETTVCLAASGARMTGQIYWYNFDVKGREAIGSGDYLAHWSAQGKPAQRRLP